MKKLLFLIASSLPLITTAQTTCSCLVHLDSLALPPCDDCSSSHAISLPFNFNFYGVNYDSVWVNNNGNVSFVTPYGMYSSVAFPNNQNAMIAPFWASVSTIAAGSGAVYYKRTPTHIIIKWDSVGYYHTHIDKLNTFQLILTNGSDSILPAGYNVEFCYGTIQWTTGEASCFPNSSCNVGANNYACSDDNGYGWGFCGDPATVGANKGDGINYIQFGRFNTPGPTFFSPTASNNQVGWLSNKKYYFNVSSLSTALPLLIDNNCDTLNTNTGDTVEDALGINKITNNNIITIAPNPFTSQTTITFSEEQKNALIKVVNVLGEEIKTINFTGKQLTIDKGAMPAGIYFLQIQTEKGLENRKVVVE